MAERRRIGLYLRSRPSDGGVFQYASSVLRAVSMLPTAQFDVVVAYTRPEIGPYLEQFDVEAHCISSSQTVDNWIGLAASALMVAGVPGHVLRLIGRLDPLVRKLSSIECDLWIFPAGDTVLYRSNLRSVAVIHDLMHRYERRFPEVGRWTIRTRRDMHYRALCASADRLIADSELGARHIVDSYGVDRNRISVLPFSAPARVVVEDAGKATAPELPARYFYYPAQFWPHKNHLNLARAIRLMVDRGLDPHVVLSGGAIGSHRAFAKLAADLNIADRFTELGYVPDDLVATLYARSIGLVYPSYFGPTNIPPLEALLYETPMAVSGNYGMREQLMDAALFFDPDKPESIAESMAELSENPGTRSALIEAGRKIVGRYQPATFDTNIRQIIEEITGALPPRNATAAHMHLSRRRA